MVAKAVTGGIAFLRNLLMKQGMKKSKDASGIMTLNKQLADDVNNTVKKWVESAKKQGQDIDKMGEQELKYLVELNKPKAPRTLEELMDKIGLNDPKKNRFLQKEGEVIQADFGKPFAEEVGSADNIIKNIKNMEPIDAMKEANSVIARKGKYKNLTKEQSQKILKDTEDHIFERDIPINPEDMAQGGRIGTGLNYLLGEDDQNSRVPFKDGTKFDPKRRTILKGIGALATLPIIGKYFKWAKPLAKSSKVLTQVPINNIDGMPLWFKPLVNKVIKEGDDVTKKFATADREIVHTTKLPNSQTDVIVTQDLTSGNVSVDIGMGKHGFADGLHGQPVRLEYKASELIEPPIIKEGKVAGHGKGTKTKEEFWVEEAEFTGGHPENVKFEDVTYEKFGQHGSDFDEVEKFATGAVKNKVIKKASGGRVPRSGGGILKILKGFLKKKPKKLETVKDFVDRRKFIKSMVGNTEKNRKARELKRLKDSMDEARRNPGFKFKDIDIEKEIQPILNKGRKLHATGGRASLSAGGLAGMLGE